MTGMIFSHVILNVWAAICGKMIFKSAQTTIFLWFKTLLISIIVPVTTFLITIALVIPVHITVAVTLIATLIILVLIKATSFFTVTLVTTVHGRVLCILGM
jgi:hypothetical protein